MSQENGYYHRRTAPKTEPSTTKTLSKKPELATRYEALINRILEEAEDDSYWTTSQRLEDGENGLAPINIVSTLLRMADKLKEDRE